MGRSRITPAGGAACAILLGLVFAPAAISGPSSKTLKSADAVVQAPPPAASHHDGLFGHLPPQQQNIEVVGQLSPTGQFGDIRPGQIADVAVFKGFAYLNSWDSPVCERGGTYVVDIRDPSQPKEVAFIPAPATFYHGEGAHVVTLNTPQFQGDVLAVNDETYGSNTPGVCSDALDQTVGGFDLYNVTDPANPVPLVQGAGDQDLDNDPNTPPDPVANSYHSVFVWQDGPRAFLVASDNIELTDVDIFDITDPRNPVMVGDHELADLFPQILDGENANGNAVFNHDMVVKQIGGRPVMLVSNWDSGYVQIDVTDPANPTLINDTTFSGEDPLRPGSGLSPEGNAHQGEFSHDNQFFLAADEDFGAFRNVVRATSGPTSGRAATAAEGNSNARIEELPDQKINGPSVFAGDGCDPATFPAAPADDADPNTEDVALIERGGTLPSPPAPPGTVCGFADKFQNAEDKGWDAVIVFNQVRPDDGLVNMSTGPADIPGVQMRRVHALGSQGVLSTSTTTPPIGTAGPDVEVQTEFDGWGYAHLYDAANGDHIDAFSIPEAQDERFALDFGVLSIHEFATDPTENLAYSAYYSGGMRVLRYDRTTGLTQVGSFIAPEGNDFWGVEQFTTPQGERLFAGSDRDYGLYLFRYTGPGAAQKPACSDTTVLVPFKQSADVPLPCSDANGNSLTQTRLSDPAGGTIADRAGGGWTYTHTGDRIGPAGAFTFKANDGAADSNVATASLVAVARGGGRCFNRFVGSGARDVIVGSQFGDRIGGAGGRDAIAARAGDDCASGGRGADRVSGEGGRDRVSGNSGNDRLFGGAGRDRVIGGSGRDRLSAGGGRNRLSGGGGNDRIGARNDRVDRIRCGGGNDRVTADLNDRVARDCELVRRG